MVQTVFDIKGSMLAVSVIHLYAADLAIFEKDLKQTISNSPDLFINMPVLIDLAAIPEEAALDFKLLKEITQATPLIMIGLRKVPVGMQEAAKSEGWSIVTAAKKVKRKRVEDNITHNVIDSQNYDGPNTEENEGDIQKINSNLSGLYHLGSAEEKLSYNKSQTLKVNQPVRSGQQIYTKGDIVLLKMVSVGAEILADGDVHSYAPMRGRVLAGVNGDKTAQIFCQSLTAELVSIAGYFKLFDQISDELKGKPVRIYLENDQLQIEVLM